MNNFFKIQTTKQLTACVAIYKPTELACYNTTNSLLFNLMFCTITSGSIMNDMPFMLSNQVVNIWTDTLQEKLGSSWINLVKRLLQSIGKTVMAKGQFVSFGQILSQVITNPLEVIHIIYKHSTTFCMVPKQIFNQQYCTVKKTSYICIF